VLAAHRLVMARVSRDESVCSCGRRYFQEGEVVRVGKLEGEGLREHRLATLLDALQNGTDIFAGKGESRSRENGSIISEDAIVVKRYQIIIHGVNKSHQRPPAPGSFSTTSSTPASETRQQLGVHVAPTYEHSQNGYNPSRYGNATS
jgi:hypothetical protein